MTEPDEPKQAQRYRTSDETEREAGIATAALAVQRGQLVVLPTDTVYGIGADAFDADAVPRPARGQGAWPRDAAAGAGLGADHPGRAGGRGAVLRPGADRPSCGPGR